MSELHCTEIPGDQALEFWSELEPYVIRALAFDIYNTTTIAKLREQVSTGFARVLVCHGDDQLISATIVQLHRNTLEERILHVVATAGSNVEEWLPILCEGLKDMARAEECDAITMAGRPGWARKLTRYGFKTDQVQMRMSLNGRQITARKPNSLAVVR